MITGNTKNNFGNNGRNSSSVSPINICLLGSTGSIGTNLLDLIKNSYSKTNTFCINSLAAATNIEKLLEQSYEFKATKLIVPDLKAAAKLNSLGQQAAKMPMPAILVGEDGMREAIESVEVDWVVNALSGTKGLIASILAVKAGKKLLLANKESLVAGGEMLMRLSRENNSAIVPLDSEHNAVIRCLPDNYKIGSKLEDHGVRSIHLTASGGPFLGLDSKDIYTKKAKDACQHPTWNMGQKISVDSASMMNKGFEIIEACHLFKISEDKVKVVIHPKSIAHCLVEYQDGSMLAQLSIPDMRITINQALSHPDYKALDYIYEAEQNEGLDLLKIGQLDFIELDDDKFPCLELARKAHRKGGINPLVLSIADDLAIEAFLEDKILFGDIPHIIDASLDKYAANNQKLSEDIKEINILTTDISKEVQAVMADYSARGAQSRSMIAQ